MRNPVNPACFHCFKKRRKSSTMIKSRTSRRKPRSRISFWSWLMYNSSVQTHGFDSRFATPQIQKSRVRFMLIRKSRDVLRGMFIGLLLFALPYGAFAQDQKQPAEKPPPKKSKAGADSCDGAVDIVPGKAATFTRKRRPSKSEAKSQAKSEAKSGAKP